MSLWCAQIACPAHQGTRGPLLSDHNVRSAPSPLAFAIATLLLLWASASRGAEPDITTEATDLSTLDLEQLMKIEVVVAASKRPQATRDVPSFVSVITGAEIKEHGYRTVGDVLKTLPSFYVTNDRNYSYVGVRGFERTGDYNSRILMLLNGLRTNDNVYNLAYIGEEFIVDVDMIERIEVIRGPSAALYGSNAFFAVINVVTKQGRGLHGAEVATSAASFGTYAGRASFGRSFADDAEILVSATLSGSEGRRLYYPEFDDPATNNGITDGADGEDFRKLLATAAKGDFSFLASHVSRDKGIPTGAFTTAFNDDRTHSVDDLTLASLSYNRSFSSSASLSARLHTGRYTFAGEYVYDPSLAPTEEGSQGEWWGIDVDAGRQVFPRHYLTIGAEYRDNYRQDQKNFDPEPYVVYTDVHNSSTRWGMFAQDDFRVFDPLTLHVGVRLDQYEVFGSATSPRVGLIYTPVASTTIKLLAGRAFRAPNEYELHFEDYLFKGNPELQPETIETLELVAQRFIGRGVQVSASAFRNRLSDLVSQVVDPADSLLVFENSDELESRGIELGIEMNRGHGLSGQLSYSFQHTEDRSTGVALENAPQHMVKVILRSPLVGKRLTAALDAQYLGSRNTLAGNVAPDYVVTNLSLLAPKLFGQISLSATLYNLFDGTYGNPGSDSHLQDIIDEDGRSFRVKTSWNP